MITQRSQRQQSTPAASSLFHFHLRRLPALRSYSAPGGVAACRRPNPRRSRRANHASGAISRRHAGLPRRRPRSAAAPGHHARHRAGLLPHPGPIPQPTPSLKSLNSTCSVHLALCSRCPGVRFGERARTCACLDCAHAVDDLPRLCRFYCTLMVCLGDLIERVWRALLSVDQCFSVHLVTGSRLMRVRWGFATDWLFCWAFEFLNGLLNLFVLGTLIDCLGVRC